MTVNGHWLCARLDLGWIPQGSTSGCKRQLSAGFWDRAELGNMVLIVSPVDQMSSTLRNWHLENWNTVQTGLTNGNKNVNCLIYYFRRHNKTNCPPKFHDLYLNLLFWPIKEKTLSPIYWACWYLWIVLSFCYLTTRVSMHFVSTELTEKRKW